SSNSALELYNYMRHSGKADFNATPVPKFGGQCECFSANSRASSACFLTPSNGMHAKQDSSAQTQGLDACETAFVSINGLTYQLVSLIHDIQCPKYSALCFGRYIAGFVLRPFPPFG